MRVFGHSIPSLAHEFFFDSHERRAALTPTPTPFLTGSIGGSREQSVRDRAPSTETFRIDSFDERAARASFRQPRPGDPSAISPPQPHDPSVQEHSYASPQDVLTTAVPVADHVYAQPQIVLASAASAATSSDAATSSEYPAAGDMAGESQSTTWVNPQGTRSQREETSDDLKTVSAIGRARTVLGILKDRDIADAEALAIEFQRQNRMSGVEQPVNVDVIHAVVDSLVVRICMCVCVYVCVCVCACE